MDQRELESRVKALTKSVAANDPPETAIKLLDSLKKDASPTEEMLRVSGRAVLLATAAGTFSLRVWVVARAPGVVPVAAWKLFGSPGQP